MLIQGFLALGTDLKQSSETFYIANSTSKCSMPNLLDIKSHNSLHNRRYRYV